MYNDFYRGQTFCWFVNQNAQTQFNYLLNKIIAPERKKMTM